MWNFHSVVLEVYGVLTFTFYVLQFWYVAPILSDVPHPS